MNIELSALVKEEYIADLKSRLKQLTNNQKALLKDLANGFKEVSISQRLGSNGVRLFREKELIAQAMGERLSSNGVCKAIALGVLFNMITITRKSFQELNFSLNKEDIKFWAYMGCGFSSYEIANRTGMSLDLINNRRRYITRQLGASTIYQATALAACALKNSQSVSGE